MPDPQMRAADTDREAIAGRLGDHMAAGRLSVAEYEDRVARAYAAKTYGELAELTADLPSPTHPSAPAARPSPAYSGSCGAGGSWASRGYLRTAWASWFTTSVIVLSLWLITSIASGGLLYFWPIWVVGPWGAVLLARTVTGPPPRRDRRRQT